MANDRYYIEKYTPYDDNGGDEEYEILTSIDDFAAAVDIAADYIVRQNYAESLRILSGDVYGPDETVARLEDASVAENHEAHRHSADVVLTIDVPAAIPREYVELAAANEPFEAWVGAVEPYEVTVYPQMRGAEVPIDDASKRYQMLELAPRVRRAQRDEDEKEEFDDSAKRFALLELDDDVHVNPKRRRKARRLTQKGVRYYRAVVAQETIGADAKRRGARTTAARAVARAAQRGVPGLLRQNGRVVLREPWKDNTTIVIEHHAYGYSGWLESAKGGRIPISFGRRVPDTAREALELAKKFLAGVLGKHNPAEIFEEDADAAVEKFTEFHRYDPSRLEELDGLEIPHRVKQLGAAKYVLYRSGKVDPSTMKKPARSVDYIHEHDAGVTVYSTEGAADTDVPKAFRDVTAIVKLGKCLGFALRDGTEAKGETPLPDLACTPDGKCLLVIQDKRHVLAMFWGGALGVFARGIDG